VVEAARAVFSAEGVAAPLDAVARQAGVGPGTVHRHFRTKDELLAAIVVEDLERRLAQARELEHVDPGGAMFELLDGLLDDGRANLAVKAALAESGFELQRAAPHVSERLQRTLRRLLVTAQEAGSARAELNVRDVKAALVGALAAQEYAGPRRDRVARARELALAGLRP
jgi:AcrR family transcriptional regulator